MVILIISEMTLVIYNFQRIELKQLRKLLLLLVLNLLFYHQMDLAQKILFQIIILKKVELKIEEWN